MNATNAILVALLAELQESGALRVDAVRRVLVNAEKNANPEIAADVRAIKDGVDWQDWDNAEAARQARRLPARGIR